VAAWLWCAFYAIFPHNFLIAMFGVSFGFACVAITVGALRFWRAIDPSDSAAPRGAAAGAMRDAATRFEFE
jgi:citrate/tricarballylate utilization protein